MAQVGTGAPTYELIRDFLKLPERGKIRPGQPRGDRLAGPHLRLPAQGPAGRGVRPRRQLPRRLGHRRGHRPARPENRRRHGLHHRPFRLSGQIIHARRQGRCCELGQRGVHSDTGCTGAPWLARTRGRAVQPPHRDDAAPQRRHLRHRRLPQRPRAPLHARRAGWSRHGARRATARASSICRTASPSIADGKLLRRRPGEQAHPDLHARRRVPRPVDRHGRAERHHARPRTARSSLPSRKTAASRRMSACAMPRGNVLVRMESRHVHGVGVDSRGDIYAGLTVDRSVDKFVRVG